MANTMTSHKTAELQEFIEAHEETLSKQTIKTYINDYKRFRTQMSGRQNIYNLTQKEIIDIVQKTDFNKRALLNIAIVFLKWKNKEHTRLIKYRTELMESRKTSGKKHGYSCKKRCGLSRLNGSVGNCDGKRLYIVLSID